MKRLLFVPILLLSSCSFLSSQFSQATTGPLVSSDNAQNESAPLRLDILSESNTDGILAVQGEVTTKTNFSTNDIGVRVRAIDGKGDTVEGVWFPNEMPGSQIAKDTKLPFTLTIPVQDITDYQVEVLWGEEARKLTKKPSPKGNGPAFVALRNLRVQRLSDPKCAADPCLTMFIVSGEIFNSGEDRITGLVLSAGMISVPEGGDLDLPNAIPHNERRIEVKNLALEPGGTKPLRLQFDEMYDAEVAQYLKPSLKIVSVITD